MHWRTDGPELWRDPRLLADPSAPGHTTPQQLQRLTQAIAAQLGLPADVPVPAREDPLERVAAEARLPAGDPPSAAVEPFDELAVADARRRAAVIAALNADHGEPVGYALPLHRDLGDEHWTTGYWQLRRGALFLIPGDSPMGLRLPLSSLAWAPPPADPERSPFAPATPLPTPAANGASVTHDAPTPAAAAGPAATEHAAVASPAATEHAAAASPAATEHAAAAGPAATEHATTAAPATAAPATATARANLDDPFASALDLPPAAAIAPPGIPVLPTAPDPDEPVALDPEAPDEAETADPPPITALCTELRDGHAHIFMPPLTEGAHAVELIAALERAAAATATPVVLEGYAPPSDPHLAHFSVTPDPGVIEVNIHPSHSWRELVQRTLELSEAAKRVGLATEKFAHDGTHTGTGGGSHLTLGGVTPPDSPLLRRPDLLRSLVTYWQHHPSLSYLFAGRFVGPTSQAPRVDEGRHESLYELEIAFAELDRLATKGPPPSWQVDRLLRNLLVDLTGNTHRAEFCIDKLFDPLSESGRLGVVELRGFEMPPHPRMALRPSPAGPRADRAVLARALQRPARALGYRSCTTASCCRGGSRPTSPTWPATCSATASRSSPTGWRRSWSSASRAWARCSSTR